MSCEVRSGGAVLSSYPCGVYRKVDDNRSCRRDGFCGDAERHTLFWLNVRRKTDRHTQNRSARYVERTWITLKRYERNSFGLGSFLKKEPSLLGPRQQASLGSTLSVCHSSPCLQTSQANMEASVVFPPQTVSGMVQLDKGAFQKTITVPHVTLKSNIMNSAFKCLKKYMLKLEKLKPVQDCDDDSEKKEMLLNPTLVTSFEDLQKQLGELVGESKPTFAYRDITVGYDNWKAEDILKAVLPANQEGAQSYSVVGHILHLNLRDHLMPYKTLIGQVYLDKEFSDGGSRWSRGHCGYREGERLLLRVDFARVYWNPRLSTEHGRVAGRLFHGDVLYDVMAGVGPFAIPAGRKKCHVLANDLNPDSYDALVKNCTKNKVQDRVKCFNMDGHDFIKTVLKADLLERWKDPDFVGSVHITMNLPALAVTFLTSFQGLMYNVEVPEDVAKPIVHVYMFTKDTAEDIAIGQVAENLGYAQKSRQVLEDSGLGSEESKVCEKFKSRRSYEGLRKHIQQVVHVRQVAPNKAMMRVSFELPLEVLMEEECEEPRCKKMKTS
ncbi:tRNA (guanine(37)-N1)-methyltransferase [Chionoecetes opilio]|uniref:tRNA (guanine(37)-N1)-methyltransferase n=1 Tax=Chionoecetes opilio TaxID=41210 RepID=A0A8J5C217_CHIOP|nr:tRNA (guanine(37)-N1)-methyltransferase [Chionoecetes opilio]